ncbi:SpoIIE family protein phosphatase [Oerskovia sp. M15]
MAGHGPDEAALGATLRTAWRTLVLSDVAPDQILPLVERVLVPERARPEVFVTLCQVVISPDRTGWTSSSRAHAPLLLQESCSELPTTSRGRALGIPVGGGWRAERVALDAPGRSCSTPTV